MQETLRWPVVRGSIQELVARGQDVLTLEQREDVLSIMDRFTKGKGRMITNATGTGKTFVALGTVISFLEQGRGTILIVTPTDNKCKDWISEAREHFDLEILQLDGIRDRGGDIAVTTYANYYQNDVIVDKVYDLIIYDESHYIIQNGKGHSTSCLMKHKLMMSLPSMAEQRGERFAGPRPNYNPQGPQQHDPQKSEELKRWQDRCTIEGKMIYNRTKVLYLSATPFAYHNSIQYGDGTLWDIEETWEKERNPYRRYNEPDRMQKFMCENFGYHMAFGKLTKPEVEVNTTHLEREFFEKMRKAGVMSTRTLVLDVDYSRHFVKVDSDLGLKIEEFFDFIRGSENEDIRALLHVFDIHFNYIRMGKILESSKALNYFERIDSHLVLDRKIVIFHGYNNVDIIHPFYIQDCTGMLSDDHKYRAWGFNKSLKNFYEAFPEWKEYDISYLSSVPQVIKQHYGDRCVIYNGTVNKNHRLKRLRKFMEDNSEVDIMVIQSRAGREGLSLHDTTNVHQRVMIDFSLPVAPTEAIQKEGRIYRHGTVSNGIYEYPTLQTSRERMDFAQTIANRSAVVENLAMGNLARDLESAFKNGYENYEEGLPTIAQGRFGKNEDRVLKADLSPFDKALTHYYQRQRANKKMGRDYFPTPEPLGYKMVEWAGNDIGHTWLEPSCGDGAIARYFPDANGKKILDVNLELLSIAKLRVNALAIHLDFMEFKIVNKAQRIIMNPPFGHGGRTAVEHLLKALIHLSKDGKGVLYCILPEGPLCDKHFGDMVNSGNMKFFEHTGTLHLPACTFKKAGTSVATRIVRFEATEVARPWYEHDLSHIGEIKELFEVLRNFKF